MSRTPTEDRSEHRSGDVATFRRRLLAFFDRRHRDLPWRRDPDPYAVWVSEIMCQQTQVDTVIPYYERWMRRFPDIARLADADEADVLKAWEGLGYYSRARNLHRAARIVRDRLGGELPDRADSLRELPGIGRYTAGAIASIAFRIPEPAVDGNVRRVVARLTDSERPTAGELQRHVASLLDPDRPGAFNQALMELGALVCTPRSPACHRCPVAPHCLARERGTQLLRPRPRRRQAIPEGDVGTAIIVAPDGRLLLRRRPRHGLLAGLWEFPGDEIDDGAEPAAVARRIAGTLLNTPLADNREGEPIGTVTHTFSHKRLHYHAFRFPLDAPPPPLSAAPEPGLAWATPPELEDFALPVAQRRLAALL